MNTPYQSWGLYPKTSNQHHISMPWRHANLPDTNSILPFGQGKSNGDACLNNDGTVVSTHNLNHFISFNKETGRLTCESGVTLAEMLKLIIPHGWFLPVTPGTKFITLGGAIANDVHGKNHHKAGTFGHHVIQFELLRSDGSRTVCSPTQNTELFKATIGGIGLTGLITWAEISLTKIAAPFIMSEQKVLKNIGDFFEQASSADTASDYTVAWLSTNGTGKHLGKGIMMQGNFSKETAFNQQDVYQAPKISIPTQWPVSIINNTTVKMFNSLYYTLRANGPAKQTVHYNPFFYPLDVVHRWNLLYGKAGFLQYQCVIPTAKAQAAFTEMLERFQAEKFSSFLTTLKIFGDKPSIGNLSFPRSGATLALDVIHTPKVFPLLTTFDKIVAEAGGALYLAKDARMSPEMFVHSYPKWETFKNFIDPKFSSSLWRRVTNKK